MTTDVTGYLPILTFHAIEDERSLISFPPALFGRGIAHLHECGYRTLRLREMVERLRRGVSFPERSIVITFDDGYQSVYDRAFPILRHYGFSATVFLTVGKKRRMSQSERLPSMCERSMLSWSEISEMHRSGFTFGAHTLTHPDLTKLSTQNLETEIVDSKTILEDQLAATVDMFAYPFGRYDLRCRAIVSRNFACAASDKLGLIHANSDIHALERVDVYYLRTYRLFTGITTKRFPLYVWARSIPRRLKRSAQYLAESVMRP